MGKVVERINNEKQQISKPKKVKSIKRTFVWYLPLCVLIAYLGAYGIGWVANELQVWFEITYSDVNYQTQLEEAYAKLEQYHEDGQYGTYSELPNGAQIVDSGIVAVPKSGQTEASGIVSGEEASEDADSYIRIEFLKTINGITYYDVRTAGRFISENPWLRFWYNVISYGQGILMVGWVLLCVGVTGIIFYKRELEKPINVLMDASEKISENCLDFEMEPVKQNELGKLCRSFEDMRQALYENNRELWHTLEERKRLNAAFSHDIRTPLSVLKGYQEMLRNYVPEGKFSEEQLMEMIETMGSQIERLENYTQKMSAVQKLEDIVPERITVKLAELAEQCRETGSLLAGNLIFELQVEQEQKENDAKIKTAEVLLATELFLDKELVLEVFENLVSNGARFAKSRLFVSLGVTEISAAAEEAQVKEANATTTKLLLTVEDDGPGFSEEALHRGTDPFYGSEKDGRVHFGLGLYICKTICEKHGGELVLENRTKEGLVLGSLVEASFEC